MPRRRLLSGRGREPLPGKRELSIRRDLDGVFLVIAATNFARCERGRFSAKPGSETSCATWWMIPSTAIFTIPRWCGGETFSWRFRPTAKARRWRRESGANSKSSLARNMANGWRNWDKIRQQLFASKIDPEERRRLLHELASREAFEESSGCEDSDAKQSVWRKYHDR